MSAKPHSSRRIIAGLVAGFSLLLSGCLLSPGKFAAQLDIRKDGRFSYSYTGEIFLLGLSELAQLGAKSEEDAKFEPSPCYRDDLDAAAELVADAGDHDTKPAEDLNNERDCTEEEIAKQKADWEDERKAGAERRKKDAEMMRAMMGGLDPTNPKAAEEFAERLRRQAGWKSVTYEGNGLFKVDFAIQGRLDHDFAFPSIERFPTANTFVVLNRRADGAIRLDAPGFGPANAMGGLGNLAQLGAMGSAAAKKDGDDDAPKLPEVEGTLSLTTDAEVLANNTDEGPQADTTGKRLDWKVNARTATAPMALLKVGN
jgi:hypothetical protein